MIKYFNYLHWKQYVHKKANISLIDENWLNRPSAVADYSWNINKTRQK